MKELRKRFWIGVSTIFAAYFYFLIFAQFGFLELVRQSDLSQTGLRWVMASMAVGGLIGSFLVPLLSQRLPLSTLLRFGLSGCALTCLAPFGSASLYAAFSILIGFFLGIATVALASTLRSFFSFANGGLGAALGTGAAYVAANLPFVFRASPWVQGVTAGIITLISALIIRRFPEQSLAEAKNSTGTPVGYCILLCGILVWFDSAAFFIIQHSSLKEGTWGDVTALWRNAAVHCVAALIAGSLIRRLGFLRLLGVSFCLLAVSGLAANHPELRTLTGWLYPAGVSIYSTCLVAFPAFGTRLKSLSQICWTAAFLYAFSGWICSGLGIGMAENLQRVPWQFVAVAAVLLAIPASINFIRNSRRELPYAALVLLVSFLATIGMSRSALIADPVSSGRAIYISEGCINCHSQFIKPGSRDETLWGPARSIAQFATESPPLFGNRRQGPDLMTVGNRRSHDWLKLHFTSPRLLAPGSSMPSYSYLFADSRGEELISYLLTLKSDDSYWGEVPVHIGPGTKLSSTVGRELFLHQCAACHGPDADGRGALASDFRKAPSNLVAGPHFYAPVGQPHEARILQLARIIRFGIPGTDMPGHEYFSDKDVFALAAYIEQLSNRDESLGR